MRTKSYLSSIEVFETLPEEVKMKAISIFGAYSEVNVSREYGRWTCSPDSWITKYYAPDHVCYFFDKNEIKKKYKNEIEIEENRYEEECKNCNWEALND